MSTNWFSDFLSEKTKLKACRYLLHHYLGDLLKDNVSLEQLSVDIFNGRGTIENLSLDDEFINHWLKSYSVPVELVSSIIDRITVTIPWSTLLGSSTLFEVHGLNLILKPKCRYENGPSFEEMVSSMTSMTSSLQMAEEMLKNEKIEKNSKYDGANIFADTIDSVLSRVKVSINDISICLDHLVKDSSNQKLRLEMRIQRMDFFDDMAVNESVTTDASGRKKWEPSAIACKNFKLSGVTFHVEECTASSADMYDISRSSSSDSSTQLFESAHSSPPLTKSNPTSPDVMTQQPTSFSAMNSFRVPPIQIATLSGTSEVRMKMKQNEAVSGPKLEVDVQIGALDILMCPRQVHILLEILSCFTNPASSMVSPTRPCRTTDKPMKQMDYLRVEDQLQKHLMSTNTKYNLSLSDISDEVTIGLQGPDDCEEGEEMFYSLFPSHKGTGLESMESSTYSNISEKSTSTAASGISSSTRSRQNSQSGSRLSKDPVQKLLDDPSVELSKLRLKMSSLTMTVLHENPATSSVEEKEPFERLKKISTAFFGKIRMIIGDMILSDVKDIRSKISEACPYDHLGLICRSIVLDSSQKSSANHHSMALDCSVVLMDVVECLFDRDNSTAPMHGFTLPIDCKLPEYCELLTFAKHSPPNMGSMSMYNSFHCQHPALKLSVISVNKPKMSHRHTNLPKTEVSIELGQFTSEVDITIINRINNDLLKSDLLRPPEQNITGGVRFMSPSTYTSLTAQALYEGSTTEEKKVSLKVSSFSCTLCVRFPIPDLRSEPQVDRLPWWKRNLHKESLVLKLNEVLFQTVLGSNESCKQCELKCHSFSGALHESPDSLPVNFINVEPDDDESTHSYGFNWPRMVITHTQDMNSVLEEDSAESDESTNFDSLNGACQFRKAESSPFSTKKFMYHKEEVSDKSEVKNVSEEHVLPGDKEELREFQEKTAANSCLLIEITVPKGDIFFHSKDFYELIYNRLCNDLLLWEPTAPSPLYSQEQSLLLPQTLETQYRVQYIPPGFMSDARNVDSDSDSDESQGMNSFSPFEQRSFHKKKSQERKLQSKLSFTLNLNKGNMHMASKNPAPEEIVANERNSENTRSELAIYAKDATLFIVINHNGDPDLQFICFQSNKIELLHNPCVETPKLSDEKPSSQADLFSTIKKSEFTFDKNGRPVGCGPDSLDMFSVAVKVKFDNKIDMFNYPAMKEFTIAVGVQGATLNHRLTPMESSWFSQALDFMNVVDYPVKGYVQPQILTQLHVHLWNCTVDYRPLHLPLHTLLHTEWLSLSSNIFAESMSTMLRFQFERTGLFISENVELKCNLKDYVCVADWDRFELCVRTSGEKETKIPKRDVTLGSNRINVRTCSDSCIALMELIQYIANDGDLTHDSADDVSSTTTKPDQDDLDIASLVSAVADPAVMDSTILVHDMMEDAMKESALPDTGKTSHGSHSRRSSGAKNPVTEVYFMPPKEEKQPLYAPTSDTADDLTPSVDLSSSSSSRSLFSSTMSEENTELSIDEEYCILDDVGMGVEPRGNCPEVKVYAKQPLQLKENYFYQPLGRTDALKSPEHFPVPETRHTLKEMSIHWYMYGGSDFGPVKKEHPKKNFKPSACDTNSTLQGYRDTEHEFNKTMKERNRMHTPYDQGGPGRDTDILMELQLSKVRMLHETYPANCEQVSRQVLLIHDVEVLDRLSSSPYNKFLYQYTSESTPRQTYANMLVIKALHTRPDPAVPAEECALKISVQPIKLNIDQDALFFLMKFMTDIMYGSSTEDLKPRRSPEHEFKTDGSRRSSYSSAPLPILSTATQAASNTEEVEQQQELLIKFDLKESVNLPTDSPTSMCSEMKENRPPSQPTYFKSVVFSPDLHIRLDYNGKRVDMEQGTIAGLLVGLAQLNCSELKLRRINYRHGLLGIQRVLVSILTDWLDDIKKNQIPRILGGVGPIHSVVQLIQGIKDLFWLPIEQYRRDGRIVRGLQRGASSFTTSTAMAVLELTNRLVKSIQYLAMLTYDMVSPGPSVRTPARQHRRVHKRSKQPTDIRDGMANAYIVLKQGISETAETIVRAATEEHEQKGVTGAVGGVIRQIPPTIVQPIILASEATSNVLGGMRNQLVPDARREDVEKWKVPTS